MGDTGDPHILLEFIWVLWKALGKEKKCWEIVLPCFQKSPLCNLWLSYSITKLLTAFTLGFEQPAAERDKSAAGMMNAKSSGAQSEI